MGEGSTEPCSGCGLQVPGGATGCQSIMDTLLALQFSHPAYFAVHRLFVDTYSMQHPERYCVSFKSLAAHLAHLCWSLECGGSRALPSEGIRRWVERQADSVKPALPELRGTVTIDSVARTTTPAEHHQAVEIWARATWEAYASLHSTARHWVDLALGGEKRRSTPARLRKIG